MSDYGKAIYGVLSADAAFGALAADRIYPSHAVEDNTKPYVAYTVISDIPDQALDGATGGGAARVQVDVYDEKFTRGHSVKAAIIDALDGYAGTSNGVRVQSSVLIDSADDFETDTRLHRVRLDFSLRT